MKTTTAKFFFYRVGLLVLLNLFIPSLVQAMGGAGPNKKKSKAEKSHVDPMLKSIGGTLSFDKETKEALLRAKQPGTLVAEAEMPAKIFQIEIVGAKKIEPDAVILRLHSKIGQMYNPATVSEDVLSIFQMGIFEDVKVLKKELPSGAIVVRYVLKEIPTIFQIKIIGNKVVSEDEIKESISGLENYHGANIARLKENAEKIREFYISKGYYLATIDYEIKPTLESDIKKREKEGFDEDSGSQGITIDTTKVLAPDFVDVIFKISENKKIVIDRISFSGNKYLSEDLLRESMRSQELHFLSMITDWGTFNKEFIETDMMILEKVLHDNGFLRAKVEEPNVEISPDKSRISVHHRLVEGDQYTLGNVSIEGDLVEKNEVIYRLQKESHPDEPIFLATKLLLNVSQKTGDVFNKSTMAFDIMAIAEKYRDNGFAYANVSPIPTFNDEEKTVDIAIKIESGPKVFIERIDIEGNDKTKDVVIRRELKIDEGDLYSATFLKISEQSVQRLGYFESVEFSNEPGSAPDKMITKIKVKEQSTGNIQAGAGWGTGGEGVVIRGQISNHNLFGRGQTLTASVNWSNYRRMFDVAFIEPYLTYIFDNPLTFAFTAYNRNIFLGEFSRNSSGGDFTFGYPIGGPFAKFSRKWQQRSPSAFMPYVLDFDSLWFYLTYTVERVEITDSTIDVRKWDLHQGIPRYTTSLRPTIRLDQRDNRIFPTKGIYFEFRTELASEYLGAVALAGVENQIRQGRKKEGLSAGRDYLKPEAGVNNFARFGTNFRFYHNLDSWFFLKGLVFKTNFDLGFLNTFGKPLIFENYALGGINTVRGYYYRSLSPVERTAAMFSFDPYRDVPIGGNKQIFGSLELEFPIFKSLKIGGVLFFDYGNVFSHEDNLFYLGAKSASASRIHPSDPLRIYNLLGLYSSVGFGLRWLSPLGYLRFEWGFPLNRRPPGTPGFIAGDSPVMFEFNIGPSF